ncbi:MAG: T9SS type A sorting domain-containing protein [Flavobacteriaceae bacterium]
MKKVFTIIALFIMVTGFSQIAIEKSNISSGGASTTNGTLSMIYSIGEIAVNETSSGNIHISEGFISSKILNVLGVIDYSSLENIQIYPNPTIDFVNINFGELGTYTISIFNNLGKELKTIKTNKAKQQVSFENYADGVYIILIKNSQNQLYKTFKLIKS